MLSIKELKIYSNQRKPLVDISFDIINSLALVGQSGSGKSLTLKAILGMLPDNLKVDINIDAPFNLQRGKTISFVPQNPFTALSPRTKIKNQWFESIERAKELFDNLGLDKKLLDRYPPELSGGQLQRVILAMALSISPKLILLDEPTTALDPNLRRDLLTLLIQLHQEYKFKMLFVSHDIQLASQLCENMLVIKEGRVVEKGNSKQIINSPKEIYTKELIEANFARREFRE